MGSQLPKAVGVAVAILAAIYGVGIAAGPADDAVKKSTEIVESHLKMANDESNIAAKLLLLKAGLRNLDRIAPPEAIDVKGWAELCLLRSRLSLELAERIDAKDLERKNAFLAARKWAQAAVDAKIPAEPREKANLALGVAIERSAYFGQFDSDRNYAEAFEIFTRVIHENRAPLEGKLNRGRCQFRWGSGPSAGANKTARLKDALADLSPIADDGSPLQAEAAYWSAFSYWYLADNLRACDYFVRSIEKDAKPPHVWAGLSAEAAVHLVAVDSKTDVAVEMGRRILNAIEKRALKVDTSRLIAAMKQRGRDKEAEEIEVQFDALVKIGGPANLRNARALLEKMGELRHSTNHHLYVSNLALFLKSFRPQLSVSDAELSTAYQDAIQAIAGSSRLHDAERHKLQTEFKAMWVR